MNSYEVVIKAIEFNGPERVPLQFPDLGYVDIEDIPLRESWTFNHPGCSGRDEWGCYWTIPEGIRGIGRVTGHPLSDWENFDTYEFPEPQLPPLDRRKMEKLKGKKYLAGSVPFTLFERMHFLRGFKNLLVDMYLRKDRIKLLADKVLQVQIELVKQWAEYEADGIFMTDDWGTTDKLFIRPELWREIFKPRYKRLFDEIHRRGMHAIMHSDGCIIDIVPDWIEVGLDVLHNPSIRTLFGIREFGEAFGGKICIFTGVDAMSTLVYGTKEEIFQEVKEIISAFGRFNGGLIAGWPNPQDTIALRVPLKNIKHMYEAFRKFGVYDRKFTELP